MSASLELARGAPGVDARFRPPVTDKADFHCSASGSPLLTHIGDPTAPIEGGGGAC
jgi:hypothetical protein